MKMRKLLCVLLASVLIIGLSSSGFAISLEDNSNATIVTEEDVSEEKVYSTATLDDDFADDRILVLIKHTDSLKLKTYTADDFPEIKGVTVEDLTTSYSDEIKEKLSEKNVRTDSINCQDVLLHADLYDFDVSKYNQIVLLRLPAPGKQNVLDAIKVVMKRDDVLSAGPVYRLQFTRTPNDTNYSNQSAAANQMKLPQAWDVETGKASVKIGVIDTGIYTAHPDLQNRVNTNLSRNHLSNDPTTLTVNGGHGTHVAGIIGAQGNNSTGIAGVAWNCTLISLCVGYTEDSEMYADVDAVIRAIEYAEDINLPILNLSAGTGIDDYYLYQAIEQYTGLFVCGAGNYARDIDSNPFYPAAYDLPNIISVGSCQSNDAIASTSCYGRNSVDIFALGVNVYSTTHTGSYGRDSGTSYAAPYVTGVAALLKSECSAASNARIKSCILNNADRISALSSKCVSGGRLNAYEALSNVHVCTYTSKNGTYHTATCSCGMTKTEEHNFRLVGNIERCLECGYAN